MFNLDDLIAGKGLTGVGNYARSGFSELVKVPLSAIGWRALTYNRNPLSAQYLKNAIAAAAPIPYARSALYTMGQGISGGATPLQEAIFSGTGFLPPKESKAIQQSLLPTGNTSDPWAIGPATKKGPPLVPVPAHAASSSSDPWALPSANP